jgi:hypothetical protein
MTQGAKANKSGHILERTVEGTLQAHGYFKKVSNTQKQQQLEDFLNAGLLPKRYARNIYIGMGIYTTDIYADFFVIGSPAFPSGLIIECKWQESGGSVDEKYPYLNLNIERCYPVPAIVIVAGGGMRQKAIDWFKQQVELNENLIAVHSCVDTFISWANKNI